MLSRMQIDTAALAKTVHGAAGRPILVVGDSITKGVCYDEARGRHILLKGQDICSLVCMGVKAAVENLSRFGCVSSAAWEILCKRLERADAPTPALVALSLGGNDCDFDWEAVAAAPEQAHSPRVPLEVYAKNLTAMIQRVRDMGAVAVLFNLPPIDAERYFRYFTGGDAQKGQRILQWLGSVGRIYWWHERYNAAAERVAQATKTPLLMIRAAFLSEPDYRRLVSGDGLHPNAEGHRRMAETVLAYVQNYLPGL